MTHSRWRFNVLASLLAGKLPDLSVPEMGWKSDWLYRLVFEQFERAWSKAQAEVEGRFGPPSASLLVAQYKAALADGAPPYCRGLAARAWSYAGDDWKLAASVERVADDNAVRGMFYHTADGRFFISQDRKNVVIEYTFGPRYGRGYAYIVEGQGNSAELVPKPDSVIWHS